jgi:hypothetical protein
VGQEKWPAQPFPRGTRTQREREKSRKSEKPSSTRLQAYKQPRPRVEQGRRGEPSGQPAATDMAEQHKEESGVTVLDKISDKLHGRGGGLSSSSDSDDERSSATAAVKAKIYRIFGREKPVHSVLGGGKRKPGPQLLILKPLLRSPLH